MLSSVLPPRSVERFGARVTGNVLVTDMELAVFNILDGYLTPGRAECTQEWEGGGGTRLPSSSQVWQRPKLSV